MQTKKSTLYTIIVLLVIFLPIAAYGLISNINLMKKAAIDNPNKELFYEGSLYFYDEKGELLGKYKCENPSDCSYAEGTIDDKEYGIDYYKNGEKKYLVLDSDDYVFVEDGDKTILYSLVLNDAIITYDAIKFYNANLATNILFVKYDGKWGVLSLANFTPILEYKYDFIGLPNNFSDGTLATDNFIVSEDNNWSILDSSYQEKLTDFNMPIKSFNDKYVITTDNKIYDNTHMEVSANLNYKDAYTINEYLILITDTNVVLVYEDLSYNNIGMGNINDYENISFVLDDDKVLNIYTDGTMATTIDLA